MRYNPLTGRLEMAGGVGSAEMNAAIAAAIAAQFPTGTEQWVFGTAVARDGWVIAQGGTIGDAASGASERADDDTEALWKKIWNSTADGDCPVVGGRGGSANADWAASKKITLPDFRGRSP